MGTGLAIICLAATIVVNSAMSLLFKLSASTKGPIQAAAFIIALLSGTGYALLYAKALSKIKLNVAYPTVAIGSLVLITLSSALIFRETMTLRSAAGMIVAIAGIALITV